MEQFYESESKYIKIIKKYMEILNINLNYIENSKENEIKNMINKYDNKMLEDEIRKKKTLKMYGKFKNITKEIKWYDNSKKTNLMIKARTDTLKLNWRKKYINEEVKCICGHEVETLEHFLIECEIYNRIREKYTFLQRPYIENKDDLIGNILLFQLQKEDSIENRKQYIQEIWIERQKIIESENIN